MYATMETLLANTIGYFVDSLSSTPSKKLFFLSAEATNALYFVPISIVVLSFVRGCGYYLGNFYLSKVGLNVVNTLRKKVFAHMTYLPQPFFDQNNSGELVSLLVYNIDQVTASVTSASKILLRDGLTAVGFLCALLYYNWKLTLIFFVVAPVLGALVYLASRYFRKTSRKIQSAVGQVTHIATESLQGIKLVKSFGGESYESQRFGKAADTNLRFATKFERVSALQTPTLHFIIAIALAIIFILVKQLWTGTPGDAVTYVTLAGLIAKPLRQLSNVNAIIQKGIAASESIFDILDKAKEQDHGTQSLNSVRGKIEFKQVNFSYDGEKTATNNIDLSIEPGETVALVGQSGSGKTTLAHLLLRFYEPNSGSISIDGIPINDLKLDNLRDNIALVNQQTVIFNDSVKANIAYGQTMDKTHEAAIHTACEHAHASEFIQDLEHRYDTVLGESGDKLSGGQRQRIAIARALYKNAPILILDEATAALDNQVEKQIQAALDHLKEGRTTLVIAHRLSTIENADKIVVMENGVIIETGTHQSLIEKNGHYANNLYNTMKS